MTFSFNLLLYKEDGQWVAQALEYDIAAQGASISEAETRLSHVFAGHVRMAQMEGRRPLADIAPAPEYLWELFKTAEPLTHGRSGTSVMGPLRTHS